ncbi:MAG: two-component system sensor histidine kinase CreC [Spirochaetes bacterium]|jgi:two-component system sensor histidine kinase CreC|nr:two-component system sensor histidine kinase CreC [Spirochaetota bacterium]
MNIKLRLVITFSIIAGLGFYYIFDSIYNDIRPRYFETAEESMNDTVNILAAYLENNADENGISLDSVRDLSLNIYRRRFKAKIYSHRKTEVDLQFYICDRTGRVIFDSDKGKRTERDYSQWNDVYLALQGKYGARSTSTTPGTEGLLYVSAPLKYEGTIIGTVTVEKPKQSIIGFIRLAQKKVLMLGIVSFATFVAMSILLSFWVTLPIKRLTLYVNSLGHNRHSKAPMFSGSEIRTLASTFEQVFRELDGKKYIESYVNTLAHEIKSPLTSIKSAAELLTENMDEGQKQKFIQNILRESSRIQSLIEKMLLLASLENRSGLQKTEQLCPDELINDIITSLSPQAEHLKVNLINTATSEIIFIGEYFLIRHALLNLADNALKNSPTDSTVNINCEIIGNHILFTVRDHGSGIPDYALDRLFEKFYSLSSAQNKNKGTGLGLAFVKECAALHKGSIKIENCTDDGVLATLTIPINIS